jgi:hypothetical protein
MDHETNFKALLCQLVTDAVGNDTRFHWDSFIERLPAGIASSVRNKALIAAVLRELGFERHLERYGRVWVRSEAR